MGAWVGRFELPKATRELASAFRNGGWPVEGNGAVIDCHTPRPPRSKHVVGRAGGPSNRSIRDEASEIIAAGRVECRPGIRPGSCPIGLIGQILGGRHSEPEPKGDHPQLE